MSKPRILTLPVKRMYFDQIKSGDKTREYREVTPYWIKRIEGREYDHVTITLGYPKRNDTERRLTFPWCGYERETIEHPHFGNSPVEVFAVKLSPLTTERNRNDQTR